jgi:hypothetical protein
MSDHHAYPPFHVSAMSKRGGESIHRGKPTIKKRKGVKIQSRLIPDSDEDTPSSNLNTEYMRTVRTRVKTSGRIGSVTVSNVAFVEPEDIMDGSPPEVSTEDAGDNVLQGTVPKTKKARRKREKANDTVSLLTSFALLSY